MVHSSETDEVAVVPAFPADCAEVVRLWHAAGLTRPWNDPVADFGLALGNATSAVLLARRGKQLCGSVMVGFDGHRGWIYYLAVDAACRHEGIGRLLMQASEAWLKARGCPKIQLMVRGGNEQARGFYAAIGYELQDVVTIGRRLDA